MRNESEPLKNWLSISLMNMNTLSYLAESVCCTPKLVICPLQFLFHSEVLAGFLFFKNVFLHPDVLLITCSDDYSTFQ